MPEPSQANSDPLLAVEDLAVTFRTREGMAHAVRDVSLTVARGDFLGIVGESGSGKSMTLMSLLRLTRDPNLTVEGHVWFDGEDLLALPEKRLQSIRGDRIAIIFQDAMTALTPVYTVGWHITEQLRAHRDLSRKAARARAIELLREVGIPSPEVRVDAYPHELSGGMRQRAVIAMALACEPSVLLADEPTTALDVTTQAQILDLMRQLRSRHGSAVVFVTHDIGVIAESADQVLVMYGGRVVEQGQTRDVLDKPQHPYTWGLLGSVPQPGMSRRQTRLVSIPGAPPSPLSMPPGCAFVNRCAYAFERCAVERPPLTASGAGRGHADACWLPRDNRASLWAESLIAKPPQASSDPDAVTVRSDHEPAPE